MQKYVSYGVSIVTVLQPYYRNPRHNDAAVGAVARSITEFGFRQPIVVDEDGVIIAGHTRYKEALKLGLEKVPVHVVRGLSPDRVQAYRLAAAILFIENYALTPAGQQGGSALLSVVEHGRTPGAHIYFIGWASS